MAWTQNPYAPMTPIGTAFANIARAMMANAMSKQRDQKSDAELAAEAAMAQERTAQARHYNAQAQMEELKAQMMREGQEQLGPNLFAAAGGDNSMGPVQVAPEMMRNIARMRAMFNMAQAGMNPEQITKGDQNAMMSGMAQDVLAGRMDATKASQALYPMTGREPFKGMAEGVTNVVTGDQALNQIGTGRVKELKSKTDENYAQAGDARSRAAKNKFMVEHPEYMRQPGLFPTFLGKDAEGNDMYGFTQKVPGATMVKPGDPPKDPSESDVVEFYRATASYLGIPIKDVYQELDATMSSDAQLGLWADATKEWQRTRNWPQAVTAVMQRQGIQPGAGKDTRGKLEKLYKDRPQIVPQTPSAADVAVQVVPNTNALNVGAKPSPKADSKTGGVPDRKTWIQMMRQRNKGADPKLLTDEYLSSQYIKKYGQQ